MIRSTMAALFAMGLATSGVAEARWYENGTEYDWARVVSVEPIFERFEQPVTRDVCWNERVHHAPRYVSHPHGGYYGPRGGDGTAGAVLGAIVGGALGNTVGRGDGRRAATIAGAVIGGTIGHNLDRGRSWDGRDPYGYYEPAYYGGPTLQRVCDQRVEYRTERRLVGYDVAYVYNGRTFRTQTREHPGDRIRVAVSVAAVGY